MHAITDQYCTHQKSGSNASAVSTSGLHKARHDDGAQGCQTLLLPTHHVIQAHSDKGFSEPTPEAFISKGNSDSFLSQHRKL